MMKDRPSRNLALELVRVTEAAALSAGRFMGRGQKEAADKAAVDAISVLGGNWLGGTVAVAPYKQAESISSKPVKNTGDRVSGP